jgi:hypothetical protein
VTGKPSVPQVAPPKCVNQPPAAYFYILMATLGWLFGWPVTYVILDSLTTKQDSIIHSLESAGSFVWSLSLLGLLLVLMALKEYSPTLSIVLDGLWFLIEVLSMLLG